MSTVVPFSVLSVPLGKALGLSVVVERFIEFGKNYFEPRIGGTAAVARPDAAVADARMGDLAKAAAQDRADLAVEQQAEATAPQRQAQSADLQNLRDQMLRESDPAKRAELLRQAAGVKQTLAPHEGGELDEQEPVTSVVSIPATDPDDGNTRRAFVLQLLGLAVGILLASIADLRLFTTFLDTTKAMQPWLDHVLTGLFIGGGSGPVHTLIQFISERKVAVSAAELATAERPEQKLTAVVATATAATGAATGDWVDIPYEGGVDVTLLEGVHHRDRDPDLVVYHHTAMSSASSFEDVVRVIKSRTDGNGGQRWLTGYNCVILVDGSVHAFCRWDRYGSHAAGYNRRSLGIAFNGNFETNPYVPYANPDGRYGAARPTDAQLRAGARVVALWTILYGIKADFQQSIIPHRQIASKACPGSNFPYADFERLVQDFRSRWAKSPVAKASISAFNLKPYLHA